MCIAHGKTSFFSRENGASRSVTCSTIPKVSPAAVVAVILIAVVVLFQTLLALGMPWGAAAWGGRHRGVLPSRLRIASVMSAVILGAIGWLVLAKGGRGESAPSWYDVALCVVVAYFGVGTIVNLISRSKVERIWAPVSLAIALLVASLVLS